MFNKAVFLDKDGTLIENVPYNVDPDKIRLVDGALDCLKALSEAGYQIFVISNQSGVAHGRFPESALQPVEERLRSLLGQAGIPLAAFYFCPHHPDGVVSRYRMTCFCRKPSPGMLFQAAREHEINLAASWFIGDILNDVEAGKRADCHTILIDNGNETEWRISPLRVPHYTVRSLPEAAAVILLADQRGNGLQERPHPVQIPISRQVSRPVSRSASNPAQIPVGD